MVTPADACTIAAALGLEVPCFDVNSACTSFLVAMHLLSMMDPEKLPRFVLSVVPEGVTRTVDYTDRTAAVLWGDGDRGGRPLDARARPRPHPRQHARVEPGRPRQGDVPRSGHFRQEGRTVQTFAIKKTVQLLPSACATASQRPGAGSTSSATRRTCSCSRRSASCATSPPERHHSNVEWIRQHRRRRLGRASSACAGTTGRDADDVAVVGRGRRPHLVELPAALRGDAA